ncbi:MAG: hypothetical protein AAFV46_07620, partial [Cyanobacteria bacterium J06635_11]
MDVLATARDVLDSDALGKEAPRRRWPRGLWQRGLLALCTFGLATASPHTAVWAASPVPQTFLDWCQTQSEVSFPARRTIRAVMEAVEASDCEATQAALVSTTELNLGQKSLSDLRPL